MTFMDENFLLTSETAKKLYDYAKDMPIFDYHCHLDPREIYEDKPFEDIVEIWLSGDHYKWRLMRANGVPERLITGDGGNKEKFEAFAKTVSIAVGNPVFHWTQLEMASVFEIYDYLNEDNWEDIYERLNAYIKEHQLSPRKLITDANVRFIGTTDGPLDSLEWHEKIAADKDFDVTVAPTFRPDEAFVDHHNFVSFTEKLAEVSGVEIKDFASYVEALADRVVYFADHGCKASDISFGKIAYYPADESELDAIFQKAINGEHISEVEAGQWQTEIYVELCRLYKEYGLVAQVHFGPIRNNNTPYAEELGPDTGFDSINDQTNLGTHLNALLDRLSRDQKLPKMIWYNLNPQYNTLLANTVHNYQANEEGIKSMVNFGAAWWFADTKLGMIDQMNTLADQGILYNFLGMLTDSRSFLSYPRHEYFRRILASYLGDWVEAEEIPNDEKLLKNMMENICYKNAERFFK